MGMMILSIWLLAASATPQHALLSSRPNLSVAQECRLDHHLRRRTIACRLRFHLPRLAYSGGADGSDRSDEVNSLGPDRVWSAQASPRLSTYSRSLLQQSPLSGILPRSGATVVAKRTHLTQRLEGKPLCEPKASGCRGSLGGHDGARPSIPIQMCVLGWRGSITSRKIRLLTDFLARMAPEASVANAPVRAA